MTSLSGFPVDNLLHGRHTGRGDRQLRHGVAVAAAGSSTWWAGAVLAAAAGPVSHNDMLAAASSVSSGPSAKVEDVGSSRGRPGAIQACRSPG